MSAYFNFVFSFCPSHSFPPSLIPLMLFGGHLGMLYLCSHILHLVLSPFIVRLWFYLKCVLPDSALLFWFFFFKIKEMEVFPIQQVSNITL